MIRFVNCIKRRADLSPEQFRQHWNDPRFVDLIERMVELMGATLYAKNATLVVEANDWVQQARGSSAPFDGILEYWWDHPAHLVERAASPSGKALTEEMLDFQRQFVDLEASSGFFVEG